MSQLDYHKRPEWSYSAMKKILDSGIDYAVGARQGLIPGPDSVYIDLGQLVHQTILGGDEVFVVSEFPDFRTNAAKAWRDEQKAAGRIIVTEDMAKAVAEMVKNIRNHPHSKKYLTGVGIKHEQELFARTNEGVELRGKADANKLINGEALIITDIKTTAQFDKFVRDAFWRHYDLQAAVYTLIAASHMQVSTDLVNYYFCVVETVKPYRVQYFHASLEFVESGERKLRTCIDAIVEFGDKQPNFLIEDIKELGDYSL